MKAKKKRGVEAVSTYCLPSLSLTHVCSFVCVSSSSSYLLCCVVYLIGVFFLGAFFFFLFSLFFVGFVLFPKNLIHVLLSLLFPLRVFLFLVGCQGFSVT